MGNAFLFLNLVFDSFIYVCNILITLTPPFYPLPSLSTLPYQFSSYFDVFLLVFACWEREETESWVGKEVEKKI